MGSLMSKKYINPPIIEALCEFQFEPGAPWDITMPGLIYNEMKEEYPHKEQIRTIEVEIRPEGGEVQPRITGSRRMRFLNEDRKALIQIDVNLLSVNHLKPYPTWEKFYPMIQRGFETYVDVAKPKGIKRIGLRYINEIIIPGSSFETTDYFNFVPQLGDDLPQEHGFFSVSVDFWYAEERDSLRLTLSRSSPQTPDSIPIVLDLDYVLRKPDLLRMEDVFDWVQNAHGQVEIIFEGCITEKLRKTFNKEDGS